MCTDGLRSEVVDALAPFWKKDGTDAAQRLHALIARLEHGDEVAMTFGGKHASKNGMLLHMVRPMLRLADEHEELVNRAVLAGHWGQEEVTLRATVRLPADQERRRYAKEQFVYLMSLPYAGLRELRIEQSDCATA